MRTTSFYIQQMQGRMDELEYLRYRNKIQIDKMKMQEEDGEQVNPHVPEYEAGKYLHKNEFWSGRDKYVWLRYEVEIPETYEIRQTLGYFDFGKTGSGNNSAFESMIYVNGREYQGVDSNHKEVFFPLDELGHQFQIDFRLWSGLEGGGTPTVQYHQFKEAFIAELDEATDDLYYWGSNMIETIKSLPEENPLRYQLENILVEAMKRVNYTNIASEDFYISVKAARDFLTQEVQKLQEKDLYEVACIGHTHIDVAWLWRLKHTREKISRSFSTVLRLMERYEEYRFIQTQAQLYDYIKKDFPEIYLQIKEKVKDGKWEPSGSMWVEADCNLISGESMIRQILYGKRFFQKEFGYDNCFLWLPDVFGYSWAMPQILKKSGIDTFITTKISWNEINRMPNDTFLWRGLDGTEILTHFITTPDVDSMTWFYTYNGNLRPSIVKGLWKNYRNKDLNQSLLLSYGYGDGGGGVNRDMLENGRRITQMPCMPKLESKTVTNYLNELHEHVFSQDNKGHLAVWDNELYLEYHRGTYTSQAYNKKMNRKLEIAYREAEILSVLKAIRNKDFSGYPTQELSEGWKIILRNQFHDIIPGSSIEEVYQDSKLEYAQAWEKVETILDRFLPEQQEEVTVVNTALWERADLIEINCDADFDMVDKEGRILTSQRCENHQFYFVEGIEPLKEKKFMLLPKKESYSENAFSYTGNSADSVFYHLKWNEKGQLTELFDKHLKRNVLAGVANELQIFEDKPRMYDAWELEATIDDKKQVIDEFLGAELISNGPLFLRIRFSWKYNHSLFTQDLVLYHHSKRIDFITEINWQEREKVLKVAFPVDIRSVSARYDIQCGSVERPTHRSTSWDEAKFEVVGHQWADLSETGFGVALMNDCKYGYDIKDNVMRLTLLKSAIYPDVHADIGIQKFTYSIMVHEEEWYRSGIQEEAWSLNAPLGTFVPKKDSCDSESLFEVQGQGIVLDAMKKTEEGNRILLRMHEWKGGKREIEFLCKFPIKSWYECDLMENPIGEKKDAERIRLEFKPFEIKTIIIE